MADDERRAEIEAMARAMYEGAHRRWAIDPKTTRWPGAHKSVSFDALDKGIRGAYLNEAEDSLTALDRVRDARGDDEAGRCRECGAAEGAKHDQMCALVSVDHPLVTPDDARSPQDEDHERRCSRCGADITDALDASYERGFQQGYDKRSVMNVAGTKTEQDDRGMPYPQGMPWHEDAKEAVCDARGDDEGPAAEIVKRLRYSDGIAPDEAVREIADWIESQFSAARSPQGEDHEHSWQNVWRCRHCDLVQPPAVSPSRDARGDDEARAHTQECEDAAFIHPAATGGDMECICNRVARSPKADENQEASQSDERRP